MITTNFDRFKMQYLIYPFAVVVTYFAFFLVIIPLSIILRLIGRDALRLKVKAASTYWIKSKSRAFDINFFRRQG